MTNKANQVAFIRRYAIMVSRSPSAQGHCARTSLADQCSGIRRVSFSVECVLDGDSGVPRPLPVLLLCVSAEDCFRSAPAVNDRTRFPAQREQATALKIDQLRSVMELFPATPWAPRARVVLGVLLIEREPAEATKLLRAAQPELPVIDDYVPSLDCGVVVETKRTDPSRRTAGNDSQDRAGFQT